MSNSLVLLKIATNLQWAMVFARDPLQVPPHPSPLYEAMGEGLILGLALWLLDRSAHKRGCIVRDF